MNTWKVICQSCRQSWLFAGSWSVYEREQLESRPCPHCGSYTLSSPEPTPPRPKSYRIMRLAAQKFLPAAS